MVGWQAQKWGHEAPHLVALVCARVGIIAKDTMESLGEEVPGFMVWCCLGSARSEDQSLCLSSASFVSPDMQDMCEKNAR